MLLSAVPARLLDLASLAVQGLPEDLAERGFEFR